MKRIHPLSTAALTFQLATLMVLFTDYSSYSQQLPSIQWGAYYDAEKWIPSNVFLSNEELIDQIAIDDSGPQDTIYVVGRTSSINENILGFPWETTSCPPNVITLGKKAPASFLAKYSKDGKLLWSKFLGTDSLLPAFTSTYGYCLATDQENGGTVIYVGGELTNGAATNFNAFSCDTSCGGNVYDKVPNDNDEGFVAKYNSQGQLLRWTYMGGSGSSDSNTVDEVLGIAVHPVTHQLYITGYTESTNFGSSGLQSNIPHYNNTLEGKGDIFIASLNSCLQMTWFTYYGGPGVHKQNSSNSGQERGHGIKIFHNNNYNFLVVTGTVESKGLAVNANYDSVYSGGISTVSEDAFIMRWDLNNLDDGPVWANYLGGSAADRGRSVDLDSSGNIFWTGWTSSGDLAYPASCTANLAQSTPGGSVDAYIAKFDKDGYAKWITYFGGNSDDQVNGLRYYQPTCGPGIVIIAGLTKSTNFPHVPTSYPHKTLNGGTSTSNNDAFVAAVTDVDVCSTHQSIKFATYLGGKNDEQNHSTLSYGPDIEIGKNMYVSFSTKSKKGDMLDAIQTITGSYNAGCCGNVSNTDAFIEKFNPFNFCREEGNNPFEENPSLLNSVFCYPSPFDQSFTCNIDAAADVSAQIEILDLYGNVMEKRTSSLNQGRNEIDFTLQNSTSGIYFLKVIANNETSVTKLIRQ